jgi:hypothetical protein
LKWKIIPEETFKNIGPKLFKLGFRNFCKHFVHDVPHFSDFGGNEGALLQS